MVAYAEPIYGCSATDGDMIRCGDEVLGSLGSTPPSYPATAALAGSVHLAILSLLQIISGRQ
jgi:hypothetical protein